MYIRTGPGGGGSSTSDLVYVSKSRIDPPQRLVARQGHEHRPELGAAVAAGERPAHPAQVAAGGLQLADDRLRPLLAERAVRLRAQLPEPHERGAVGAGGGNPGRGRLEDRGGERARLDRKSTRLNSSHVSISY